MFLKQSTSVVISFGPFVDKTDGVTLEVGLVSALDHATTGILLSKNGGALTIRSQAVTATTYDAYGNYRVTLSTTDTDTLGTLRVQFSEAATCLPVWADFMVVPANVWDSLFGADKLDVNVAEITAALIAASHFAGMTQPTQSAPPSGADPVTAISWMYHEGFLHKMTINADGTVKLFATDGTTVVAKFVVTDVAGELTRPEIVTGP